MGEGTTIHIRLPCCDPPAAEAAEAAVPERFAAQPMAPVALADDRAMRILVVEDEVHALAALTELLEAEGYAVAPAADYDEAAMYLTDQHFDMMLADVVLPHSNGIVLAGHASAVQPGLRIMMMSGYAPNADEMSPDWLFVRKPLDLVKLLGMIRTALPRP